MIFRSPPAFSPANIKWGKDRKNEGVGWGTWDYRNLHQSTNSFRSDRKETVKIVKIISYLFNFPSHLSPILTHRCSFFINRSFHTLNADLLFSKNGYFEAVNIQIMHSVSRSGSLLNQHAHSRTAVRNSRTETAMHAHIIWYLRAKTYSSFLHA